MLAGDILVVDDNLEDLKEMKGALESGGYKVTAAANGAQALDILDCNRAFKMIIIDIRMPTLSGYDLLRLIRERLDRKTKMVFASVIPKKEAMLDNADGFLQKPFSKKGLVAEAKKLIGK